MSRTPAIGILGAGISGLSIAYYLQQKGFEVGVHERGTREGGVIQTHTEDGWLAEKGPNTLLVREQPVWDLLDSLGLTPQIEGPGAKAKKRYIVRDSHLHPLPMSLTDFLKSDLFSISAKLRLLREPFIRRGPGEESIARFIVRRLGREALDYAVNPFVSGIYAGDPSELSVKHTFRQLFEWEQKHGSLFKGILKRDRAGQQTKKALISFSRGLKSLPEALANHLGEAIEFDSEVLRIRRAGAGWHLDLQQPAGPSSRKYDCLISTIPLHTHVDLWDDKTSARSFRRLADISYAPVSVLGLGFRRSQVGHPLDGFGMLIPAREPYSLLGCLFSSSLFEGRAPEGHVLLSCFIGGARRPECAGLSTDELRRITMPALQELLDITGDPVWHHHAFWPRAIPQYTVGYDRHIRSMEQIEAANPGFFLAGSYRGGVAVPDRISAGSDTATRVARYIGA